MHYVLNTSLSSIDSVVPGLPTPEADIRGGLAEDLLWYDRVVIVTSTFHEVKHLIRWMTIDRLVEIVERGELGFLRVPNTLGYMNASGRRRGGFTSGPGLIAFRAQGQPHQVDWREQMCIILRESLPCGQRRAEGITDSLAAGVEDSDPAEHFAGAIEAARNDLNHPDITRFIGLSGDDDVDDLPSGDIRIQRLLRVAVANHDMLLAVGRPDARLHSDPVVKDVLEAKLQRLLPHSAAALGMNHLLEIEDLPGVAESVRARSISFDQVMVARRSENGRRFREWLDVAVAGDDEKEAVREYIAAIEAAGAPVPLTAKLARFISGAIVGGALGAALGPAAGLAVGALDALLLDRLADSWTPGAFLDDELAALLG